jgi:uncharacterized protein (DUF2252 family)
VVISIPRKLKLIAGKTRAIPAPLLDVKYRLAGNGSLGLERYLIWVAGKGSPDQNYLLDLADWHKALLDYCQQYATQVQHDHQKFEAQIFEDLQTLP